MCGRYTSTSPVDALAAAFAVDEVVAEDLGARYNVAPTQPIAAVARRSDGSRVLGAFRWGLVPPWASDPSVGSRMINARAEGIDVKPAYRVALERRRCLIPADAFYEWQAAGGDGGGRGNRSPKQPWAIRRRDGAPMAFAGLWEVWRDRDDPGADPLRTAVIVTTAANATLAPIHHRMPVVLESGTWDRWLDVSTPGPVTDLLVPAADDLLEAWQVSTLVNAVARDGPELLDPPPEPPPT